MLSNRIAFYKDRSRTGFGLFFSFPFCTSLKLDTVRVAGEVQGGKFCSRDRLFGYEKETKFPSPNFLQRRLRAYAARARSAFAGRFLRTTLWVYAARARSAFAGGFLRTTLRAYAARTRGYFLFEKKGTKDSPKRKCPLWKHL